MTYNLYLNDSKLIKFVKISDRKVLFILENGLSLKRKEIISIKNECYKCKKIINNKVIPENYNLIKQKFLCKSCNQLGELNCQYNKKWTNEQKEIRSIKYTGENNPMYNTTFYQKWVEKHGTDKANELLIEHSKKCARSGKNNGMHNKTFYDMWIKNYGIEKADELLIEYKNNKREWLKNNPEHLNKMIINSHLGKYKKTSIEKIIEQYLIDNNINYKYNYICNRKYQFDFLIADINVVIEVHGDYWHANPNIYCDTDITKKKLNEQQKYKTELDIIKYHYLKENTKYDIVYVWESDIKNKKYINILKEYGIN